MSFRLFFIFPWVIVLSSKLLSTLNSSCDAVSKIVCPNNTTANFVLPFFLIFFYSSLKKVWYYSSISKLVNQDLALKVRMQFVKSEQHYLRMTWRHTYQFPLQKTFLTHIYTMNIIRKVIKPMFGLALRVIILTSQWTNQRDI